MGSYQIPVLPLSREVETKKVLKKVADARAALAELKGVHATVPNVGILLNTLALQEAKDSSAVENTMMDYKNAIRSKLPKIYSQDLINNLFKHPYTKIEFLQEDLKIIRQTSSKYLNEVADLEDNLLTKMKIGREFYFINNGLMALFSEFDYKL